MPVPRQAESDEEISRCYAVMSELRPQLERHAFVNLVRHMQVEGYRLAYLEADGAVVAVAGYRIYTNLFMGKTLYVDDLVTSASARSKGYGEAMLSWLRTLAGENDCMYLHLDSGTQRHRAHRFYLAQGLDIASFHFSEKLAGD